MNPNSDFDILTIKRGADALHLMARIARKLHGVGAAVDAIVVDPGDVESFKDSHTVVYIAELEPIHRSNNDQR